MAFHGQVALVTGGASGMGQIFARRMADGGARVAILDVNEAGMAATAAGRPSIHPWVCDVSDGAQVEATVAAVEAKLGRIDRVVHAAALMPASPLIDQPPERITRLMRINYDGTVHLVGAVLRPMVARGSGDFIVFGSVAGHALAPHLGAYCATKAAVNALMEVLIHENQGSGVRIHLTCPPLVNTPLLQQAIQGSNPRSIQAGIDRNLAADPGEIVDAVEKAVARGQGISFPGRMAKGLYGMRRLAPGLLWKIILREERA